MATRKNWSNDQISIVVGKALVLSHLSPGAAVYEAMLTHIPIEQQYSKLTMKNVSAWPRALRDAAESRGLFGPVAAPVPPVATTLAGASIEALIGALAARLRADLLAEVRAQVNTIIAAGVDAVGGHETSERQSPVTVLSCMRVLVIGLLPVQQVIFDRAVKTSGVSIDLRYWTDSGMDKLHSALRWADRTYLMTKFVSHDIYGIAKREAASLHHCNGAVSDLTRLVTMEAQHALTV